MSRNRRILAAVLVAAGAIAYGLSPLDIVPEILLGPFGLVDDLGVLGAAAIAVWKLLSPGTQPGTPGRTSTPPPAR